MRRIWALISQQRTVPSIAETSADVNLDDSPSQNNHTTHNVSVPVAETFSSQTQSETEATGSDSNLEVSSPPNPPVIENNPLIDADIFNEQGERITEISLDTEATYADA